MNYKITQQKEDCHYSTTVWDNRHRGGWFPWITEYGITQEEADHKVVVALLDEGAEAK